MGMGMAEPAESKCKTTWGRKIEAIMLINCVLYIFCTCLLGYLRSFN